MHRVLLIATRLTKTQRVRLRRSIAEAEKIGRESPIDKSNSLRALCHRLTGYLTAYLPARLQVHRSVRLRWS
ncbi:hypothetical protein [Thalassoglobus polymorphus]|uniref:hypothetical protein n=1 Tax=Thalassoglobus polymorphus TaxID=2527994 RepID=UPI00119D6F59|nr:hypothetical protein [Thalassoglobus polymorphus]